MEEGIIYSSGMSSNISENMKHTVSEYKERNRFISKNFFSMKDIENIDESDIYNIFEKTHVLLFVSNIYLETQRRITGILCRGGNRIDFGCCREVLFLPFEFKFILLDILKKHNKYIDKNRKYNKRKTKFKIIFENGFIEKGEI